MKKMLFLSAAVVLTLAAIAFRPGARSVVGKWVITYKHGEKAYVDLNADGTFRTEMPAEHFIVTGKYAFKAPILSISDTSCNAAYWGKYRVSFHGTDSLYSVAVEDSCSGRKASADKVMLIRIK